MKRSGLIRAAVAAITAVVLWTPALAQRAGDHWVVTWSTAGVGRPQNPRDLSPPHRAAAGSVHALRQPDAAPDRARQRRRHRVRVVLSNAFGTAPLTMGAAHVALRDKDAAIVAASGRAMTFSGSPTIAFRRRRWCSAIRWHSPFPAAADLAIDLYLPGDTDASRRR